MFSSCTKDEDVVSVPTPAEKAIDVPSEDVSTRATTTEYCYVAAIYKNAYKHLKQLSGECSWTSYTLTAAAVARGNGSNYPNNIANPVEANYRSKITHVRTMCVDTSYIWKLEWYGQNVDHPAYSTISPYLVVREANEFDNAVYAFLAERRINQKPCIFLGSKGGIGHFYILWDLEWNGTAASSVVYYTDPDSGSTTSFSSYNDRKNYMSLSSMLSTKLSGNKYNFLFF
ncbi:MAG: hypothetical protein LBU10_02325 [Endomicrobium sp.]|jgi:hypothetical protein|nr:hypothetical protein [Endomicrobium sp.]